MPPCWTPQGNAERGVGFLAIPLPKALSISVCMNRGRWLLLALWTSCLSVCWEFLPSVSQGKLGLILCAELMPVSVTVRRFPGSIKLLWL